MLLSTYILKTLHIWRIFNHFGKLSAVWSYSRLLVVVLICCAATLLLSIFITYDVTYGHTYFFLSDAAPPYYEYTTGCFRNTRFLFLRLTSIIAIAIQMVWFAILLLVFSILSFKTCKIWQHDFKETRKTNIFIIAITITYGILFTAIITTDSRPCYISNTLMYVCVSFLAQPIIFPPIFC